MKGFLAFAGTTLGSYVGWWLGDQIGFVAACFASVLGMGIGLYAGRRLAQEYDEYIG